MYPIYHVAYIKHVSQPVSGVAVWYGALCRLLGLLLFQLKFDMTSGSCCLGCYVFLILQTNKWPHQSN